MTSALLEQTLGSLREEFPYLTFSSDHLFSLERSIQVVSLDQTRPAQDYWPRIQEVFRDSRTVKIFSRGFTVIIDRDDCEDLQEMVNDLQWRIKRRDSERADFKRREGTYYD